MALSVADLEARFNDPLLLDSGAPLVHDAQLLFDTAMAHLERGDIRAARRDDDGNWHAVAWVKRAILLGFRIGRVAEMSAPAPFSFTDKHTYPPREFRLEHGVRIVPGGSTVRRGAYLAPNVVCMPPMYINVGAHVGRGTMVDSHALVGSCLLYTSPSPRD